MEPGSWNLPPGEIERQSFAIIDAEAPAHAFDPAAWSLIRRMIHTTGDFSWVETARLHPQAIVSGVAALRAGRPVFTDTRMAQAGIGQKRLAAWGGRVECLIDAPAVAATASAQGVTRALAAMDASLDFMNGGIYVIGNAPTALLRLIEHLAAGRVAPALVVGLPVGFVNAAESKDTLASQDRTPYITALGRKGGSAVAASVVNALAVLAATSATPASAPEEQQ
jgi:precorrin-8X/cobalt-precorrin-8 methylmutase